MLHDRARAEAGSPGISEGPLEGRFGYPLSALLYGAGALFGLALESGAGMFAGIWIADAIAIVVLQRASGNRLVGHVVAMLGAGLLIHLARGMALDGAVLKMSLHTFQFCQAALLVRIVLRPADMTGYGRDVPSFLTLIGLAAGAVPAVTAALAALAAADGGLLALWWSWWSANSIGSILVLALAATAPSTATLGPARMARLVAAALAVAAVSVAAVQAATFPFVFIGLVLLVAAIVFTPFETAVLGAVNAVALAIAERFGLAGDIATRAAAEAQVSAHLVTIAPVCLAIAVSELRRSRAELAAGEERMRRLMDDSPVGTAVVGVDGRVVEANRALSAMLGQDPTGAPLVDFIHPDDRLAHLSRQAALIGGGPAAFRAETRLRGRDGTAFWALVAVSLVHAPDGATQFVVQVEDVDERRRTLARLAEAEARWSFALEGSGQGVWDVDFVRGTAFHSRQWKAILGYAEHEVEDRPDAWLDFLHPDDREAAEALDADLLAGRIPFIEVDFRMRHRDGRWIWVRDRGRVTARDADGRPRRAIGTLMDVTAEKEAADRLSDLAERMELATDAAEIGLFEIAADGGSVWWTDRMYLLHGVDPDIFEPGLAAWRALVHPADRRRLAAAVGRATRDGASLETEYRILQPDGTIRTLRVMARRRVTPDGEIRHVGANWDVTVEREATERLRRARDDLGQFATIASHDLQSPLRQIALWADVLRQDAGDALTPDAVDVLDRIQRRARQLRGMVAGLLEFSRAGSDIRLGTVDLTRVATQAVADRASEIAAAGGSAVVGPLPRVLGDPVLLARIFDNLVGNAIKYAGDLPPQIAITGEQGRGLVHVQVRDNGIGIDPIYARAVFELFRRLPESAGREGSGVGLAVCRRMADAMGGDIFLDTSVRDGTLFVLKLRPAPMEPSRIGAVPDGPTAGATERTG